MQEKGEIYQRVSALRQEPPLGPRVQEFNDLCDKSYFEISGVEAITIDDFIAVCSAQNDLGEMNVRLSGFKKFETGMTHIKNFVDVMNDNGISPKGKFAVRIEGLNEDFDPENSIVTPIRPPSLSAWSLIDVPLYDNLLATQEGYLLTKNDNEVRKMINRVVSLESLVIESISKIVVDLDADWPEDK